MANSACVVPWTVLNVTPDGTPIVCCQAATALTVDGRPATVVRDPLRAIWNAPELVSLRGQMARGEAPAACHVCHDQERAVPASLRRVMNGSVQEMAGADWSLPRVMRDSARLDHRVATRPMWYQLQLGNTCNLACRSCSPSASSRVAADRVHRAWADGHDSLRYPLPSATPRLEAWYRDPAKVAALFDHHTTIVLSLLGGEPFVIEEAWALLRLLVERGWSRRIVLCLVTNGTRRRPELERLAPAFKRVIVSLSIDGVGPLFEYLRFGAKWPDVLDTLDWLQGVPNLDLIATPTLQNANALGARRLFRFLDERRLGLNLNVLTWPRYLRASNLPPRVRRVAAQRLHAYLDWGCPPASRRVVQAWAGHLEADEAFDPERFREFMLFTNDLDASRGQRLAEVDPELCALLRASGAEWTGERRHATATSRPVAASSAPRVSRTIAAADRVYPAFAAAGAETYFESAHAEVDAVDALLRAHGHGGLASCRAIADYASHYGRITRLLRARLPHTLVYACDIDRAAVEFCEREFDAVPVVTSWRPDEDVVPRDLDLILCISLLTQTPLGHLRRALRAWRDMLRPGGVVVFTFLDEGYVEPWMAGTMEPCGAYPPDQRGQTAQALREQGFAFLPLAGAVHGGEASYGIAFARAALVRDEIGAAGLDVLHLDRQSAVFSQSVAVARRPGPDREPPAVVPEMTRDVRVVALCDPRGYERDAGESTWSQLVAAIPPRALPTDLGFGDPRVPEVREAQAALARAHGIDAFCHLLVPGGDAPLRALLASGRPDFPFCLMLGSEETAFEELVPYLRDPRYLRHEGRPLVVAAARLADTRLATASWRGIAGAHGIGAIHLCAAEPIAGPDPVAAGFDSVLEAVPERPAYHEMAAAALGRPRPSHPMFRSVLARRDPFDGRNVEHYELWLRAVVETSSGPVFVRAWNDWVAGAYLEPDDRDGRSFLTATRRATRGPGSGLVLLRRLRDALGQVDDAGVRALAELEQVVSLHERSRDELTALVEAAYASAPHDGESGERWVPVAAGHLPPSSGRVSVDVFGTARGTELYEAQPPVTVDGGEVEVHGWAHSGDVDPAEVSLFLVLTSPSTGGQRVFRVSERVPRPDVAAAFPGYPEGCGFTATIFVGELSPGPYRIGVVQRTPRATYFDPTPFSVTLRRCSSG